MIDGKFHSERIEWIHAEKEYVRIHEWGGKEHLVRQSLVSMADELKKAGFVQVHRSWLVNFMETVVIPISITYNRGKMGGVKDGYIEKR